MLRTVIDDLGRELLVPDLPQRIVSLVPSQTELLYDLGLEERVAGITKFCIRPDAWFRNKARIGGTKTVSTEKVAALQPDLILANKEENVREQIESLSAIAPVWVSDIDDLDDALRMIVSIGELTGSEEKSIEIANTITSGFRSLNIGPVPRRVAYCIWRNPWMWAGGGTFIHDMLSRAGWHNKLEHTPRYPELSLESLAAQRPEVVLLSSEPYPFKEQHIVEIKEVMPEVEVLLVDGELFSWYGSRLRYTPPYLAKLIAQLS